MPEPGPEPEPDDLELLVNLLPRICSFPFGTT